MLQPEAGKEIDPLFGEVEVLMATSLDGLQAAIQFDGRRR
jgi:hypothetical protein